MKKKCVGVLPDVLSGGYFTSYAAWHNMNSYFRARYGAPFLLLPVSRDGYMHSASCNIISYRALVRNQSVVRTENSIRTEQQRFTDCGQDQNVPNYVTVQAKGM